MTRKLLFLPALLLPSNLAAGFTVPEQEAALGRRAAPVPSRLFSTRNSDEDCQGRRTNGELSKASHDGHWTFLPTAAVMLSVTPLPAEAAAAAAGGVVPSALWAYGHYFSIVAIFGCLAAERTLVRQDMSVQDEETVVKLDLVYGVMAALLIISGLFRATDYGQGSDFYLNEPLFWVKMIFSGIWGGLSLFPSLTFYKRNFARKNDETVPPLSDKLLARLQTVINAEISAVLSIPLIATLMARGVGYWQGFPWPLGLALALAATGGSFFFYGKQALTWTEEEEEYAVSAVSQEEE